MSRIFDALQRSILETTDLDFPLASFSAPEATVPVREEAGNSVVNDLERFQSLPIAVSAKSRLVCVTDQASLVAEKFRFLAVRLRQLQLERPLKKVLITSTSPGEGKSTIAANLALALAQRRNQRILLIDGDLRRPSLSARFGIPAMPGLSEWLLGSLDRIATIYQLEQVGLWFLPAGALVDNPLDVMQFGRLSTLMAQLMNSFDWIIIDSPPILPLADTSVWSRFADGSLLVCRENASKRQELQRGLHALEPSHVLGVVLNSCDRGDDCNYYAQYKSMTSAVHR